MKPQASWNDNLDDPIAMPFNRITQPYTSLINPHRPQILGSRVPNILGVHPSATTASAQVLVSASRFFFAHEPLPWRIHQQVHLNIGTLW